MNSNDIENEVDYNNHSEIKRLQIIAIKLLIAIIISLLICFISFYIATSAQKPIIYIYPEEEMELSIKLGNPSLLTCSYPKYEGEWNVLAKPNGNLVDLNTGRNLYALYWEGKHYPKAKFNEGFCIKGEDSASFLEEKLEILGLNEKESEEFIVYWLPVLEKNKYNIIRFASTDEINNYMPLDFSTTPDTLIRILIEFKSSNKYVDLPEQKLEKITRNGFTVVEWGGVNYNNSFIK